MIQIKFDPQSIAKIERLIGRINRAQAYGNDRTDLTRGMRDEQAKTWVQNFPRGARYGGYEGLSPSTVANRRSQGYGSGPPLIRSGVMAMVVAADSIRRGKPNNDGVFWHFINYPMGSDVGVYPVWHNEGTSRMPARKFWHLDPQDEQMHKDRAQKWLEGLGRIVISGR